MNVDVLNKALAMLEQLGKCGYHVNVDVPDILVAYYRYDKELREHRVLVMTKEGVMIVARLDDDSHCHVKLGSIHRKKYKHSYEPLVEGKLL